MRTVYGMGGKTYQKGGKVITGQNTSTVRTEQAPDGSTREFVWFDEQGNESATFDAPDGDWARTGAIKVYGNWNEYAAGQNEDGSMYLPDEQFPIMQNEDGSYSLNERMYEDSTGGPSNTRMEDMQERMMDAERQGGGPRVMREAMAMPMGGQGASPVEDLLQRLSDVPSTPMQFAEGGSMPKQLLEYFKNKN
jgi:hypothetical protein